MTLISKSHSKHYMTEKDFEIDHYIDQNSKEISPHYHEFFELYFFLGGEVDYIVDGNLYHLKKGDILLIPPNILHTLIIHTSDIPYDRFVLWIDSVTLQKMLEQDIDLNYWIQDLSTTSYLVRSSDTTWAKFHGQLLSIESSYYERKLCYRSECLSLITNLFVEINRTIYYQKNAVDIQSSTNLLTDILHYIHNNIHENLSLDLLASKLLTNQSTISNVFKRDMGTSIYQYIIQRRLIIAKNNIISGMPISKIHESCGFSDYSCFYRAFKKEYGLNPTEFKIMHKEKFSE